MLSLPYFQYTSVPTNTAVGITQGASTKSGAILASRTFKHGFSLAGRWEYIATSAGTTYDPDLNDGDGGNVPLNLLFGPGSSATVSYGHPNVSIWRLLCSWGILLGPCHRHHAGLYLRSHWRQQ